MGVADEAGHPAGDAWGDDISPERQAELEQRLQQWASESDHGERKGPFDPTGLSDDKRAKLKLSSSDVRWLAEVSGRDVDGEVPNLHLEGARLDETYLAGARLAGAHLEGAHLDRAHLEGADLAWVHGESAHFDEAHLEGISLNWAHLEHADLFGAHLQGANLARVWMDSATILTEVTIDNRTQLGDIQWNGVGTVNLSQIDWTAISRLGDETSLKRGAKVEDCEAAVRAYRQMATQLRAQGMNELADRFVYRAQVVQRRVLRRQAKLGAYLFSLFLDTLTGYGYRLGRIVAVYAAVILGFAALFYGLGQAGLMTSRLGVGQSLIESLAAFHERAFSGFLIGSHLDPVRGWVTFAEAITGLVIESTFIAMLVQRLRAGSGG